MKKVLIAAVLAAATGIVSAADANKVPSFDNAYTNFGSVIQAQGAEIAMPEVKLSTESVIAEFRRAEYEISGFSTELRSIERTVSRVESASNQLSYSHSVSPFFESDLRNAKFDTSRFTTRFMQMKRVLGDLERIAVKDREVNYIAGRIDGSVTRISDDMRSMTTAARNIENNIRRAKPGTLSPSVSFDASALSSNISNAQWDCRELERSSRRIEQLTR